jgi:hypothetical protein
MSKTGLRSEQISIYKKNRATYHGKPTGSFGFRDNQFS